MSDAPLENWNEPHPDDPDSIDLEEQDRQENCYHNCATKFSPAPCSILEHGGLCAFCDDFEDKKDRPHER